MSREVFTGDSPRKAEEYIAHVWNEVVIDRVAPDRREAAARLLAQTLGSYRSLGRHQHNAVHIAEGLSAAAAYSDTEFGMRLHLGIIFHDVFQRPDNDRYAVERSAEFAQKKLHSLGIPEAEAAGRLVLSTSGHSGESEDEAILNDIDKSVLGAPIERYIRYANDIRREFVPPYSVMEFRNGRLKFLSNLAKPIFQHADFEHLEREAERNIGNEIMTLEITTKQAISAT